MMISRNWMVLFIAICAGLLLVACGEDDDDDASNGNDSNGNNETISYSQADLQNMAERSCDWSANVCDMYSTDEQIEACVQNHLEDWEGASQSCYEAWLSRTDCIEEITCEELTSECASTGINQECD